MKLPPGWDVGVGTHTGLVRVANEDDYAVVFRDGAIPLLAVADGMGGVSGGAEASRAAVRALAAQFVAHRGASGSGATEAVERVMQRGFAHAAARVHERSLELPALRDMGTTLTAICLLDGVDAGEPCRLIVGHVGDSRLLRWRSPSLESLTRDHVLHQGQSILTNCVGAGQREVEPDIFTVDIAPGDVFALVTDGVWNVLPDGVAAKEFRLADGGSCLGVAERLVQRALDAGAPDNATAVVFRIDPGAVGPAVVGGSADGLGPGLEGLTVDLPRGEVEGGGSPMPCMPGSLRSPRWPWAVLAGSVLLGALAGWSLGTGWRPW